MTPAQITLVRFLLAKAKLNAYKEEIIGSFTDGRTGSVRELSYPECQAVVKYLRTEIGYTPPDADERQRRKILSMAHELHWEHPDGRVDMTRVDNWCLRYSGQKKRLNALRGPALTKAVTAFEMFYTGFLKGI